MSILSILQVRRLVSVLEPRMSVLNISPIIAMCFFANIFHVATAPFSDLYNGIFVDFVVWLSYCKNFTINLLICKSHRLMMDCSNFYLPIIACVFKN